MKTKDKPNNNKDKDKKIILWEVKSFPAIEIKSREEERWKDKRKMIEKLISTEEKDGYRRDNMKEDKK